MMEQKRGSTKTSRYIRASAEEIFKAFMNPDAVIQWQAPEGMIARMHGFEFKAGGSYTMSLFYPKGSVDGKSESNEDRFTARFEEIVPSRKIVQFINFDTDNPQFQGEMKMTVQFIPAGEHTEVVFLFDNIPPGIAPSDNKKGTESTLEKLARYVEFAPGVPRIPG